MVSVYFGTPGVRQAWYRVPPTVVPVHSPVQTNISLLHYPIQPYTNRLVHCALYRISFQIKLVKILTKFNLHFIYSILFY